MNKNCRKDKKLQHAIRTIKLNEIDDENNSPQFLFTKRITIIFIEQFKFRICNIVNYNDSNKDILPKGK